MAYQVLARKYRPLSFDEVVGQEHVTTTLKNAIERERIHHAYLFTGVRGTGKTSLARIFAMALNAQGGPKVDFDINSSNAQAIQKGQFLDVIEIDGASNTSVEAVRELREQVKYMPAAGKYKVYIIDEVHMLSTSAFNALLKTLEEPPPHVIFLFATTEAHKIPVTILSRCQRFDLKRLTQEQLLERLKWIVKAEKIKATPDALEMLARAAGGSMRDAQSLLDMAIGRNPEALTAEAIRDMLGLAEAQWVEGLSQDCFQGEATGALAKVQDLYDRGFDLKQVAIQWVDFLHGLILLKAAGPEAMGVAWPPDQVDRMKSLTEKIAMEDLQVVLQSVYRAAEQIFRSDMPKVLFDLLVVRLVHGSPYQSLGEILGGSGEASSVKGAIKPPTATQVTRPQKQATPSPPSSPAQAPKPIQETSPPVLQDRQALDRALKKHPQIKAILDQALNLHVTDGQLIVVFEKGSFFPEMFQEKREILARLLEAEWGSAMKVLVQESEAGLEATEISSEKEAPVPDDPVVKQAVEILNAKVKEVKKY